MDAFKQKRKAICICILVFKYMYEDLDSENIDRFYPSPCRHSKNEILFFRSYLVKYVSR